MDNLYTLSRDTHGQGLHYKSTRYPVSKQTAKRITIDAGVHGEIHFNLRDECNGKFARKSWPNGPFFTLQRLGAELQSIQKMCPDTGLYLDERDGSERPVPRKAPAPTKCMQAGSLLSDLYWTVRRAVAIDNIPGYVRQLIKDDMWKELYIKEYQEIQRYENFIDLVTTPPPHGLGIKVELLKRLIGDNPVLLDLMAKVAPEFAREIDLGKIESDLREHLTHEELIKLVANLATEDMKDLV